MSGVRYGWVLVLWVWEIEKGEGANLSCSWISPSGDCYDGGVDGVSLLSEGGVRGYDISDCCRVSGRDEEKEGGNNGFGVHYEDF